MRPCYLQFPWRFFALLLLLGAIPLAAQRKGPGSVQDHPFDIRDLETLTRQLSEAAKPSGPTPVAAQARDALEGFRTPDGLTFSYSLGRFGLPKSLSAPNVALSSPLAGTPREAAMAFLRANSQAFPFRPDELDAIRVVHESDVGTLRVVRLQQTLGGLPVYGGRISVTLDALGSVVQVRAGDAAPGLTLGPEGRLSAMDAARIAFAGLRPRQAQEMVEGAVATPDGRQLFRNPAAPNLDPAAVDGVVFPLASGEGRRAWRVLADGRELVIDAADGRVLRRVNLVRHVGSARVWRTNPLVAREVVAFPAGWLPNGGRITSGNNVTAFVDLDLDSEPDPVEGDGLTGGFATSDASGFFDHPAGTGLDFELEHLAAAMTNAFYFANLAHDYFYELGFQEADGALQESNGNRGGVPGDPLEISILALDLLNDTAMLPAPDGLRSRMRLPAVIGSDGILHAAFDGDAVLHEYTHAVSERLVGGADDVTCLGFDVQGSAISEGVSDYFAASFFDDPELGEYLEISRLAPMDRNSRTFESLGDPYFESHADGEIIAAILWQIRTKLGAPATDRLVLNAIELLPCSPTFVDFRDALLTAGGASNRTALWGIFAPRGLGSSARADDGTTNADTLFDAAFDLPADLSTGGNRPPRFLGAPGEFALANVDFIYTARAEDPNGDPITYKLIDGPDGAAINATTGRLTYRGKFTSQRVVIEATDGKGGRATHGLLIFGGAILTPGRPMSISGDRFSSGIGIIEVTGSREALQVTTRGGEGDTDIELYGPFVGQDYVSNRPGTAETITVANPSFPALWVVFVDGFREYNRVTFTTNFVSSEPFPLDSTSRPVNGTPTSETFFKITVPPGTPRLRVTTSGGTGDADLFLAREELPACRVLLSILVLCGSDAGSAHAGNAESLEVLNPAAGDWFLNLQGSEAYSGVTVNATTAAGPVQLTGASDAASFGAVISSGGIGSLFGTGFTDETLEAPALPLPAELGGARVYVDGVPAGLFYVSPAQINFQMPVGAGIGNVSIVVVNDGKVSQHLQAVVQEQVPRLFTFSLNGELLPVVTHADGSVVTPESPAKAGEILVAFLTGVAITPQPADGEAASADPISYTVEPAEVTVGGASATTLFSGATAGFVGLIQINFQLPTTLPAGSRLELGMRFGEEATLPLPLAIGP